MRPLWPVCQPNLSDLSLSVLDRTTWLIINWVQRQYEIRNLLSPAFKRVVWKFCRKKTIDGAVHSSSGFNYGYSFFSFYVSQKSKRVFLSSISLIIESSVLNLVNVSIKLEQNFEVRSLNGKKDKRTIIQWATYSDWKHLFQVRQVMLFLIYEHELSCVFSLFRSVQVSCRHHQSNSCPR